MRMEKSDQLEVGRSSLAFQVTNTVGGNQELAGRIVCRIGDRNYGVDLPVRTVLAASQKPTTSLAGSSSTAEVAQHRTYCRTDHCYRRAIHDQLLCHHREKC